MNQCVPSWDLDDNSSQLPKINFPTHSNSSNVPSLDYEVAELTWKNGQLAMNGLVPPRVLNKPTGKYTSWDKPRAGGTLESIVNQATHDPDLVPWFDHRRALANPNPTTVTMDALVPCNNNNNNNNNSNKESSTHVLDGISTCVVGCSTLVGSTCSGAAAAADGSVRGGRSVRTGPCSYKTNASVSESATCGGRDSRQMTLDTCEMELGGGRGMTPDSLWSPENTSSGKEYTRTSGEDHDSICHSRSQKEGGEEEGKRKSSHGKSSVCTKRSRAAAVHNQSERKRRDKINQRMKTLQKLVPNSSKTNKASMLDEVIEYLKQLQAQVQIMSRMNMPSMMLPLALQQQLQMSMMAPAMGMGMGMGVMDMNAIGRAAAGMPPVMPPPAAFMPMAFWDMQGGDRLPQQPPMMMPDLMSTFLACQSQSQSQQPMAVDAYSRLAALYQQFQQPPPPPTGSAPRN